METIKKIADGLLRDLREIGSRVADAEAEAQTEIDEVVNRHKTTIAGLREGFQAREKDLIKFVKKHKVNFFDATDQVDLENGLLLHGWDDKVKIPKTALKKIEAEKWEEALKRTVSVDREVVEKWPVERLVAIGATKKRVETFTYEIKSA